MDLGGPDGRAGEYDVMICAGSDNDKREVGVQPVRWIVRESAGSDRGHVVAVDVRGASPTVNQQHWR